MAAPDDDSAALDELLLPVGGASEGLRREDALARGGVPPEEIAATKGTLAALAAVEIDQRPPAALRDRLLASVRRSGRYGVYTDRVARLFDLSNEVAARLVAKLEDASAWKPWMEGMQMIPVRTGPRLGDAIGAFGRLRPGARFPLHDHVGDEVTLVLDGGFRDTHDGRETWRGDELWKPGGSEHEFVVLPGEDCIAAVVCLGGVRFRV